MPDIPLDTLFIVGLLLASFVGKLMEGRAKNKKKRPLPEPRSSHQDSGDGSEEKNLSDILRETFGEVIEPIHENRVPFEAREDEIVEDPHRKNALTKIKKPHLWNPEQEISLSAEKDCNTDIHRSNRDWLRKKALHSKKSLRRAFLLKEVLDQPPGMRRSVF